MVKGLTAPCFECLRTPTELSAQVSAGVMRFRYSGVPCLHEPGKYACKSAVARGTFASQCSGSVTNAENPEFSIGAQSTPGSSAALRSCAFRLARVTSKHMCLLEVRALSGLCGCLDFVDLFQVGLQHSRQLVSVRSGRSNSHRCCRAAKGSSAVTRALTSNLS